MTDILGGASGSFFGMTVGLFGFAALLTGRAMAETWRPGWQIMPAALLLAAADRFLLYALFEGKLLSFGGFLVAAALLALIMTASYYHARAGRMVQQYPWLYERSGPFGWRPKPPDSRG